MKSINTIDHNELPVTELEAAQRLGISLSSLRKWRRSDRGPRWIRVGTRAVRYRPADLASFLDARVRGGAE